MTADPLEAAAPPLDPADAVALDALAGDAATGPAPAPGPYTVMNETPAAVVSSWLPILAGLFPALTAILCPGWNVTPEECDKLAAGCAPVLDKYFPNPGGEQWAAEWGALGAVTEVAAPRVMAGTPPRPRPDAADTPKKTAAGAGGLSAAARAGLDPADPAVTGKE